FDETRLLRGVKSPPAAVWFYGGQAYAPLSVYQELLRGVPPRWLTPDLRELGAGMPPRGEIIALLHGAARLAWGAGREIVFNVRRWQRFRAHLPEQLRALRLPDAWTDLEAWDQAWA